MRVVALEALEDSVMLDGAAKVRTPAGLASSPLPITVRVEGRFQFGLCLHSNRRNSRFTRL